MSWSFKNYYHEQLILKLALLLTEHTSFKLVCVIETRVFPF